jgi:hypothetical protein
MEVRLSALRAGRPLLPSRFLVLISDRGWVNPRAIVAAGMITSTEKSNNLIGNWTRDLPACSILPQPTMLLYAHKLICISSKKKWFSLNQIAYNKQDTCIISSQCTTYINRTFSSTKHYIYSWMNVLTDDWVFATPECFRNSNSSVIFVARACR